MAVEIFEKVVAFVGRQVGEFTTHRGEVVANLG
jgi:hypothetical protein